MVLENYENSLLTWIFSLIKHIEDAFKTDWLSLDELRKLSDDQIVQYCVCFQDLQETLYHFIDGVSTDCSDRLQWKNEEELLAIKNYITNTSELSNSEKAVSFIYLALNKDSSQFYFSSYLNFLPAYVFKVLFPERSIEDDLHITDFGRGQRSVNELDESNCNTLADLKDWLSNKERQQKLKYELFNAVEAYKKYRKINSEFDAKMNAYELALFDKKKQEYKEMISKDSVSELLAGQLISDSRGTGNGQLPVPKKAGLILEKLKSLPKHEAMLTNDILTWLSREKEIEMDEKTLRGYLKQLKPHGVKNERRVGYYFSHQ